MIHTGHPSADNYDFYVFWLLSLSASLFKGVTVCRDAKILLRLFLTLWFTL